MTRLATLLLAMALALAACSDADEESAPVTVGPEQQSVAIWANRAAASIDAEVASPGRCEAMDGIAREYFESVTAGVLDGAADPGSSWSAATSLSQTINEAATFCTWESPDDSLIGDAAARMVELLEAMASGLTNFVDGSG